MLLFLFLNYELILFNSGNSAKIFNPYAKLAISVGILSKEATSEIEKDPVIVEAKIKKQKFHIFKVIKPIIFNTLINSSSLNTF